MVLIYDPITQASYQLHGLSREFRENIDALIAIAESLFTGEDPP